MTLIELLDQRQIPYELVDGVPQPIEQEVFGPSFDAEVLQAEVDAINAEEAFQASIAGKDLNALIGYYLSLNPSSDEDASFNAVLVARGDSSGWRISDVDMPSLQELLDLQAQVDQSQSNSESIAQAKAFLADTDWQIIRHYDQILAGTQPSLSQGELQTLLAQRQAARDAI